MTPYRGGTLAVSWGRYGGFYYSRRRRLCLGWVAFTYLPMDLDTVMRWAAEPKTNRGTA